MIGNIDLKDIDSRIRLMKKEAEELKEMGVEFPALSKNVSRILANIKMLEINISDILDMEERSRD
jgi:hypothetical protein